MQVKTTGGAVKPEYVLALEAAYGPPSQEGFGSAVFFERADEGADLEALAQKYYRYFVGDLWERWGADAWLSPWKEVYARPQEGKHEIEAELHGIKDFDAQLEVGMILDNVQNATAARKALSAAFDGPDVVEVRAYTIGDGGAVSGLLLAGQRQHGATTFLAFLLD